MSKLRERLNKALVVTGDVKTEFAICEAGDHIAKIVGIGFKENVEREFSGEKKTQDEVTFIVVVDDKHVLFSRPLKLSFHEKSNMLKNLKVILKDNTLDNNKLVDTYGEELFESLINTVVAVDVVHNNYQDKVYANMEFMKTRNGDTTITKDNYEVNDKMIAKFDEYIGLTVNTDKTKDDIKEEVKSAVSKSKSKKEFIIEDDDSGEIQDF